MNLQEKLCSPLSNKRMKNQNLKSLTKREIKIIKLYYRKNK